MNGTGASQRERERISVRMAGVHAGKMDAVQVAA